MSPRSLRLRRPAGPLAGTVAQPVAYEGTDADGGPLTRLASARRRRLPIGLALGGLAAASAVAAALTLGDWIPPAATMAPEPVRRRPECSRRRASGSGPD